MVLAFIALDINFKNMDEFTKEQKAQIATWDKQRDEHLAAISVLRTEEEKLQVKNKELASSNSDIENRMNVIRGRIEELKIKEGELPAVISKEVAFLESKKTTLESEITLIVKMVGLLTSQKKGLELDISSALLTFEVLKGEALLLDKVVDRVTTVSKSNSDKIDLIVSNLAVSLEEIIAVNRKNVLETNIVIDKVPKMIVECQKRGLINKKI